LKPTNQVVAGNFALGSGKFIIPVEKSLCMKGEKVLGSEGTVKKSKWGGEEKDRCRGGN